MTSTTANVQTAAVGSGAHADVGRRALAVLAPVGPLAMAGWALAVPYALTEEPAEWIPKVAGNMGRTELSFWLLLVFAVTAGAGAIVTGMVARRGSLRLGTIGMVLAFAGFSALSFSGAGYDGAAAATINAGLDVPTAENVLREIDSYQATAVGGALFIPLMFIGVLLLGIALWRGRTVPRWAAAALLVAFPIILAGGFVAMAVNALGWLLLAIGFAAAGAAYAGRVD
jgi:hypothetical protein